MRFMLHHLSRASQNKVPRGQQPCRKAYPHRCLGARQHVQDPVERVLRVHHHGRLGSLNGLGPRSAKHVCRQGHHAHSGELAHRRACHPPKAQLHPERYPSLSQQGLGAQLNDLVDLGIQIRCICCGVAFSCGGCPKHVPERGQIGLDAALDCMGHVLHNLVGLVKLTRDCTDVQECVGDFGGWPCGVGLRGNGIVNRARDAKDLVGCESGRIEDGLQERVAWLMMMVLLLVRFLTLVGCI